MNVARLTTSNIKDARVRVLMQDGVEYDIRMAPDTALITLERSAISTPGINEWAYFEAGELVAHVDLHGPTTRARRRWRMPAEARTYATTNSA